MSIAASFIDDELAKANPTLDQRKVATPSRHVWVRASAGSGKTKVLVDRLLRLLLPDTNGAPGIAPDKILCLTFTKAGAAEMSLRLQKRLLEWSALEDDKLKEKLFDLIGHDAPESMVTAARQLFARVLDAPSKLKIQTIHAFCQTVLGRFPVETGLSPDFKVIEEAEAGEYLNKALLDNLVYAAQHPDSDIGQIFTRLSLVKNQQDLQDDIGQVIKEPISLQKYLSDTTDLKSIQDKLALHFGIENLNEATRFGFCSDRNLPRADIKALADMLSASSQTDADRGTIIHDWLSGTDSERLETLETYLSAIKTKSRKEPLKSNSDYLHLIERELQRYDRCKLAANITATADLMYLSAKILSDFERHKKFMGVMDFNDLVFNTRRLLTGEFWKNQNDTRNKELATSWVLYKLDEGIDHILVDESQDTNPDQWRIVELLSTEYFSGAGKEVTRPRTLFVVGDEKQSIFSFHRADPAVFHDMKEFFAAKVAELETQDGFEESLIFSFRSTAPVLRLTDAVFEDPSLKPHIGLRFDQRLRHISFRSDNKTPKERYGSVELWQPTRGDAPPDTQESGWQLPFHAAETFKTAEEKLAQQIAFRINAMIEKREANAGDFMILVRQRSALVHHIIRALKEISVPVSGLDRIVLNDTLIVQDILALCDFCLLPDDSFALACLLKSPFIGLSEDELMALSINRPKGQSLWSALRDASQYKPVVDWLFSLMAMSSHVQPFEFLETCLTMPCPADPEGSGWRACQRRLGEDVLEPLDEILSQSLKLELQDIRTLQEFVDYQKNSARDIKREMEEASNQVRIMTVHGSKGLEAPIVILPDTMKAPNKGKLDKFLWPDKSKLSAPLWADAKETRSQIYEDALDRTHALQLEESSRLLYVAMTRAKETLIVCGPLKSGDVPDQSWYRIVETGFSRLQDVITAPSGDLIYRLEDTMPQKAQKIAALPISLPAWAQRKAPEEMQSLESFTPSAQGAANDEPVYSPRDTMSENRFKRGIATHKLLQILPDLSPDRQEAAAQRFISNPVLGFSKEIQDSIVHETMRILRDDIFAPVFGPNSLAEVPVTGELPGGRLINGQIDRLVITDTEILIVDYKTNRPSPGLESEIPSMYRAQLRAYAETLAHIYPGHVIKCALLWTDRPLLMPVSI